MKKENVNSKIYDMRSHRDGVVAHPRLDEAQTPAPITDPEYAIQNYPRLIQLARAGLVPEDSLWRMTNILKDPKRFGVSPKVRDQLYDLMIKTLNYIVVSDPAAWARFRSFLMKEENRDMHREVYGKVKRSIREETKKIISSLDEEKKPGEVWLSRTDTSYGAMNASGERQYFDKARFKDAEEKAKAFAAGEMTAAQAKTVKGQDRKSQAKTQITKAKEKGELGSYSQKKTSKALDGPDSEKEAIGTDVKLEKKIATRMDKFSQLLMDRERRKRAGEDVGKDPDFDLCTVTIPGTNLFCGDSLEIPRKKMPQLKTAALPGTPAEELLKKQLETKGKPFDSKAEVDAEGAFLQHLKDKGVKFTTGDTMNSIEMKATQNELVGAKVVSMANALSRPKEVGLSDEQAAKARAALTAPLIVSKDGYVLDGHHRWAAAVVSDLMQGKGDNPTKIPVIKVDMDIEDLLDESNDWGNEFGLERKTSSEQVKVKKEEREITAGEQLHESLSTTIRSILKDELSKFSLYG